MDIQGAVILSATVGSTAYGLAREGSDVDTLGIYVAPTRDFWRLSQPEMTYHDTASNGAEFDYTYHEVGKYVSLALKCNPTIVELLWLPPELVQIETIHAAQLRSIRACFLSTKAVRNAYGGYAKQQIERMLRTHERMQELYGASGVERVQQELGEGRWVRDRLSGVLVEAQTADQGTQPREVQSEGQASDGSVSLSAAHQAGLWSDPGAVRKDGRQGVVGVPNLPGPTGGSRGSLSRDGQDTRVDLPEVQSGPGALHGGPRSAHGGSELPNKLWRMRKNARHCFRLIAQGQQLLKTGSLAVRVENPESYWAFDNMSVEDMVTNFKLADIAFQATESVLPDEPDRQMVERVLMGIREDFLHDRDRRSPILG